ncbi:MAG TPA: hypothetical protein VNF68_08355, partial [Candidatus Baltobacteraceae bacterium]|nr:hypothetical protein [Candidatus Baltobacteraceae bacterium]
MPKTSTRTVTRHDLYDLIWTRPMWKVAPEFGLSGRGLAKLCWRHGIPVPERGYWAKLAHGKRVRKPRLPVAPKGEREEIVIEASPPGRNALDADMHEVLAALLKAEREATEPIHVPESPKPHPIVEQWPAVERSAETLARTSESRRRRIATILFREIEKLGGSVAPHVDNRYYPHRTYDNRSKVTFFGATIDVTLKARTTGVTIPADPKRPYSYEHKEWRATGLLRLRFENYFDVPVRREWNETEEKPLETRLREVLIGLFIATEVVWRANERHAEAERLRAEAELRWLEAERKRKEEEKRVNALLAESKAWEDARRIRAYVAVVIEKEGESEQEWAAWAQSIADRIDPTIPEQDGQ